MALRPRLSVAHRVRDEAAITGVIPESSSPSTKPGQLHSRHKLRNLERKAPRHALVDLRDDVPPICLSQDDLVALDEDGNVYQCNFKRSRPRKPRRPSADVSNSLSKTISRLGLLAIPLVLVNQDLSRDDAWFGRPPRDDCRRERLALENRLIALRTGPMLTHVLPLRNQPILLPPRGRSVGVEETRRVEMDRGAVMLEKAPLSPIPQRRNGRLESVRLAQQRESISESRLKPR